MYSSLLRIPNYVCVCVAIVAIIILDMTRKLSKKVRKKLAKLQKQDKRKPTKLQKRTNSAIAPLRELRKTRVAIDTLVARARHCAHTDLRGRAIYSLCVSTSVVSEGWCPVASYAVSGQCCPDCSDYHVDLVKAKIIFVLCQTVRLLRALFPRFRRWERPIGMVPIGMVLAGSTTLVFDFTLPCESSRACVARQRIALRTILGAAIQLADDLLTADVIMRECLVNRAELVFPQSVVDVFSGEYGGWLFPYGGILSEYFPVEYPMLLN